MEAELGLALTKFLMQKPAWVLACIMLRLLPVTMLAPPLHSQAVPRKFRFLLAAMLSFLLLPSSLQTADLPASSGEMLAALVGEVLFGLLLGSVFMLSLYAMQLTGGLVSQLSGLDGSASGAASSEAGDLPALTQLFVWVAIVALLTCGGHRWWMQSCLDSFQQFPVGQCRFDATWVQSLQIAVGESLALGLRLAVPVGMALLMSNLLIGMIARSLPQINVLSVGFNANVLVLLFALLFTLGGVSWTYQHELATWLQNYGQVGS